MWNQWSQYAVVQPPLPMAAAPPPPPNEPLQAPPPPGPTAQPPVIIGPVAPAPPAPTAAAPSAAAAVPNAASTNPYSQYTAAQYAALTPEQQYTLQQHWQQWQKYQEEYAKWHAQYGEQYKREMEAVATTTTAAYPGYTGPVPPQHVDSKASATTTKITGQPQLYNQPPPQIGPPNQYLSVGQTAPLPHQQPQSQQQQPPPPPPPSQQSYQQQQPPAQWQGNQPFFNQPPPNFNSPTATPNNYQNSSNTNMNPPNQWTSAPPPFGNQRGQHPPFDQYRANERVGGTGGFNDPTGNNNSRENFNKSGPNNWNNGPPNNRDSFGPDIINRGRAGPNNDNDHYGRRSGPPNAPNMEPKWNEGPPSNRGNQDTNIGPNELVRGNSGPNELSRGISGPNELVRGNSGPNNWQQGPPNIRGQSGGPSDWRADSKTRGNEDSEDWDGARDKVRNRSSDRDDWKGVPPNRGSDDGAWNRGNKPNDWNNAPGNNRDSKRFNDWNDGPNNRGKNESNDWRDGPNNRMSNNNDRNNRSNPNSRDDDNRDIDMDRDFGSNNRNNNRFSGGWNDGPNSGRNNKPADWNEHRGNNRPNNWGDNNRGPNNWSDGANNQGNNWSDGPNNQGNNWSSGPNNRGNFGPNQQMGPSGNSAAAARSCAPDIDEEKFDRQFKQWEEQFEDWKRANANHPDREMYSRYEKEFEKQRTRIMERREQMRRRKMERLGLDPNQPPPTSGNNSIVGSETERKNNSRDSSRNRDSSVSRNPPGHVETEEALVNADNAVRKPPEEIIESEMKEAEDEEEEEAPADDGDKDLNSENLQNATIETKGELGDDDETANTSKSSAPISIKFNVQKFTPLGKRNSRFDTSGPPPNKLKPIAVKGNAAEVINLDDDDEDFDGQNEANVGHPNENMAEIFKKTDGIPGLDLVEDGPSTAHTETVEQSETKPETGCTLAQQSHSKKIPSLFDIKVNKPDMPGKVEEKGDPSAGPIPDISKTLNDPEFMKKISEAVAKAQGKDDRVQQDDMRDASGRPLSFAEWQIYKQQQQDTPSNVDNDNSNSNDLATDRMSTTKSVVEDDVSNTSCERPAIVEDEPKMVGPGPNDGRNINTGPNDNFGPNGPNNRGPNWGPNNAGPNTWGHNSGPNMWGNNGGPNNCGPNGAPNNWGPNNGGPNNNWGPSSAGLNNNWGPNSGGGRNNFGNNSGGPNNWGNNGGGGPNNWGPNNRGPNNWGGPNGGGPNNWGANSSGGPNSLGVPNSSGGPNIGGPNIGVPNSVGPNSVGPNSGGPNSGGPNSGGPNIGGSNDSAGPNSGGRNSGGPNNWANNGGGPNNWGPNNNNFGPNNNNFGPNNNNFGPNFRGPNNRNFGPNGPNFGPNGPSGSNFGPNGPNTSNFGPNGPNSPNFGPKGPSNNANIGRNSPNFGPNNRNFGPNNGPNFGNNAAGRNSGRDGPQNQPDFDNSNSAQAARNSNNPFRRNERSNAPSVDDGTSPRPWMKGSGDNVDYDDYFRPVQVIDYTNNASVATKVIEYGHKPVIDDFKPVKVINYDHAPKPNNRANITPLEQRQSRGQKRRNRRIQQQRDELPQQQAMSQDQNNTNQQQDDASNTRENEEQLEDISDNEELPEEMEEEERECSPAPPPPPMYSSGGGVGGGAGTFTQVPPGPSSIFPSTAEANENITKMTVDHVQMSIPTVENNNTISIEEILMPPGRDTRPKKICIILRGPPGSGKSHVAKLIKEKEKEMSGNNPRVLSIDDYFLIENDYEEKCPKTGKKLPKKEILYEYDKDMEATYMQYLIKSFKKTILDNFYDFIVIDCNNNSLRTLNEFYCHSKDSGYVPYIIDLFCDLDICMDNNIHERTEADIKQVIDSWKPTPFHYIKLDICSLVQNVVEMEDAEDMPVDDNTVSENADALSQTADENDGEATTAAAEDDDENVNYAQGDDDDYEVEDDSNDSTENQCSSLNSKWETDTTTENLARLDGTSKLNSKRKTTMEEYLQMDEWQPVPSSKKGKKRVRWADIEEKREQEKMRAVGFVVGQTDWKRMMDPNAARRALNKTKYIERVNNNKKQRR